MSLHVWEPKGCHGANHNTYGARSPSGSGKVFGLTDAEISRVTGKIGYGWHLKHIWKELADHPKMRDVEFKNPGTRS